VLIFFSRKLSETFATRWPLATFIITSSCCHSTKATRIFCSTPIRKLWSCRFTKRKHILELLTAKKNNQVKIW